MLGKGEAVVGKIELAITQQRALEKEMATHFQYSCLEKFLPPRTEEPGRLQSMRVLKELDVT